MLHDRSSTRISATAGSSLRSKVTGVTRSSAVFAVAVLRRTPPRRRRRAGRRRAPPSRPAPSSTASEIAARLTSLSTTTSYASSCGGRGRQSRRQDARSRRTRSSPARRSGTSRWPARLRRRARGRRGSEPACLASSVLLSAQRIAARRDATPRARAAPGASRSALDRDLRRALRDARPAACRGSCRPSAAR